MTSWDHCRSFLAVLRTGSLSAAARELELTQPTLGRHITELESDLGLPLFVRSQAGLVPTENALNLKPHAEAIESSVSALVRTASGARDEPVGTVRLTAAEIVGVEVLPPILAAFRETHPDIDIEVALSNLTQDLSRRDADIAVRMVKPTQSPLVARKLGDVPLGLFAHRRYLEQRGLPETLEDLRHHTVIGFDADANAVRGLRQSGLPVTRELFAFRSDSDHAQLAALRAGFGIAGCHKKIAARDPNLIAVLPDAFRMSFEMWLVMHEDLRASRRVRLLYDHLAEHLRAYAAGAPGPSASKPAPVRNREKAPERAAKTGRKPRTRKG